jgi:AcrR family transcriptional regulator
MRQIAERAGIGVGTIFLYARDKQGLLFLLFSDAVLDVQRRAFESLPQGDKAGMRSPSQSVLLEQLVHVFSSFYRYYESDRRLSRLFIKELLFLDSDPAGPQPNAHANANASGEAGQPGRAGASNSRVSDAETHVGLTLEFIGRLSGLVQQAQVRGTPNFFLIKNGQGTRIPGALPYEQFKQALIQIETGATPTPQAAPTPTS